jgi:hypothetical protein
VLAIITAGMAIYSLLSQIRLAAFPERLLIHSGLSSAKFAISSGSIMAIQPSPEIAKTYFRQPVATWHQSQIGAEWRVLVYSVNKKGLMIQTKQRKYFIGCPDAEGAAKILREAYRIPDVQITPPATWDD